MRLFGSKTMLYLGLSFGVITHPMLAKTGRFLPKERSDLRAHFSAIICNNGQLPNVSSLWGAGIFDAQIDGEILTAKENRYISIDMIKKAAFVLAKRRGHWGVVFGLCPDSRGWVVTLPAPTPMIEKDGENLILDHQIAQKYCDKIAISFAAREHEHSRTIRLTKNLVQEPSLKINLSFLLDGTISISCTPKYPSWSGPLVWNLVPIHNGPDPRPPGYELFLSNKISETQQLLTWVNHIRQLEQLSSLSVSDYKVEEASRLLIDKNETIRHDRRQIDHVSHFLKSYHRTFIGENRVKGTTVEQLAWLLWTSPEHRKLLLHPQAVYLSISTRKIKNEILALLVFAKS